jgi:hypothetical protein
MVGAAVKDPVDAALDVLFLVLIAIVIVVSISATGAWCVVMWEEL